MQVRDTSYAGKGYILRYVFCGYKAFYWSEEYGPLFIAISTGFCSIIACLFCLSVVAARCVGAAAICGREGCQTSPYDQELY